MTIVDRTSEKSDHESVEYKHSPFISGDTVMDSSYSGSWRDDHTVSNNSSRGKPSATYLVPAPGATVYNSTPHPVDRPREQGVLCKGDGIGLPEKVLFPPERLSLKWNQVHQIGAGLQNMGNTCFLNSALQCLSYTPPLANYMLTREHSKIWIAKHFRYGSQEDAHEFLQYTVDAMQKACLLGSRVDRQTQATSFIHQVFGGYLRSRVACLDCDTVSDTFDPFLDLALEIKTASCVTTALEQFVKPEQLDGENAYNCTNCQKLVPASKRFTIHRSSNVLTLTLKRFSNINGAKIAKDVKYPENLDLRSFMSESKGESQAYGLYAVLVHSGYSCHSGHYYCFIKASNGQWYHMNDNTVSLSDIRSVLNQQAYVLFYVKSSNVKSKGDYSHVNRNPANTRQSSPPPITEFEYTDFVGPQLPSDMAEENFQGNDSLWDYTSMSKPSTSSNGLGKSSHGHASSSSIPHSLSQPTGIPDPAKRKKISFPIGSSSSTSSSSSSSQPTSDGFRFILFQPQVNGTSYSNTDHQRRENGSSFLVSYSHESSEESDQEGRGTLENGSSDKSHLNGTNGRRGPSGSDAVGHHNGNGLNGPSHRIKPSQNGHQNGHHKVNGHNIPQKVSGKDRNVLSTVASNGTNGVDTWRSKEAKTASASQPTFNEWTAAGSLCQQNADSDHLQKHPPSSAASSPSSATATHGILTASHKGSMDEARDRHRGPTQTDSHITGHREDKSTSKSNRRESQTFRNRERERPYSPDRYRDKHYRDRSQERDSDGDHYRYRRDHQDYYQHHHRSNGDRSSGRDRHYQDWDAGRLSMRYAVHPRERDRDRCAHHYHRDRSREDRDRSRHAYGYSYGKDNHSRRYSREKSRESRDTREPLEKVSRENDYHSSKKTSSPIRKSHKRSRSEDREVNSGERQTKKHKKSKKSKDKDRHREKRSSERYSSKPKKKKKEKRRRSSESTERSQVSRGPKSPPGHRTSSDEERAGRKRHRCSDRSEDGPTPEKRRRVSSDTNGDSRLNSHHGSPSSASRNHSHLHWHRGNDISQSSEKSHRSFSNTAYDSMDSKKNGTAVQPDKRF